MPGVELVREEIRHAQNNTQQADSKASILLAVTTTRAPLATHVHSRWTWVGWALLAGAAGALGAVVMPRLGGASTGWFGAYTNRRAPGEVLAKVAAAGELEMLATQLAHVSHAVLIKYRLIQVALLLLAAAAGMFALAAVSGT